MGETPLHTAMRHIHAQPKPPSDLRKDLAPALEKIILKALANCPGARHQSAQALPDDLLSIVGSLPDAQSVPGAIMLGVSRLGSASAKGRASAATEPPPDTNARVGDASVGAMAETELVINADPRMVHGALGAGKLGSVRLSTGPASQPATTAPSADVPPPRPVPTEPQRIPPAAEAVRTETTDSGAVEPRTRQRAQTASPLTPRIGTPPVAAPRRPPSTGKTPIGPGKLPPPPKLDVATQPLAASALRPPSEPPTGEHHKAATADTMLPPEVPAPHAPRIPRPTETGLTPTSQIARDRIGAIEEGAVDAKSPPLEEDEEPRTFVRAPPESTRAFGDYPDAAGPTPVQPTNTGYDVPADDEKRTHNNTLVMEEMQAPTPASPSPAPSAAAPAVILAGAAAASVVAPGTQLRPSIPRTLDAPVEPAARAHLDAAYDQGIRGGQLMSSAVMSQPMPSAPVPLHMSGVMNAVPAPMPLKATARMPFGAQLGSPYPQGARPMQAEIETIASGARAVRRPQGVRGKLEEFSGTALLLLGVAVGLFLALIGLLVVVLMK